MSDTPRTDAILSANVWEDERTNRYRDLASTLERELAAVTAERDALRQDAERYRWLRTRINYRDVVPPASLGGLWPPTERQWTHISYDMGNDTIDESIDAAMDPLRIP